MPVDRRDVRVYSSYTEHENSVLAADSCSMGIPVCELIRRRALSPYVEPPLTAVSPGAVLVWAGRLIDNILTRAHDDKIAIDIPDPNRRRRRRRKRAPSSADPRDGSSR